MDDKVYDLNEVLVLIGNEGIGAVSGTALQAEVGRLSTLGGT